MEELERDPEKLWKQSRNHWNDPSLEEHNGDDAEKRRVFSFFQHIKIQTILAVIVFVAMLVGSQYDHPVVTKSKNWIRSELSSSFDFVAVAVWYDNLFEGSPAFIPRFGNNSQLALANQSSVDIVAPIEQGILLRSFADLLNGIEIVGAKQAEVHAIEKGRIILVPQGNSVIIQHANERMSIYTRLSEVNVESGDWVDAGTTIGRLSPIEEEDYSVLFFSMKQGDQYIDPLEVITLD